MNSKDYEESGDSLGCGLANHRILNCMFACPLVISLMHKLEKWAGQKQCNHLTPIYHLAGNGVANTLCLGADIETGSR